MSKVTFKERPNISPTIYGYITPDVLSHNGYIKIGYTDRFNFEQRIKEQTHTAGIKYEIVFKCSAIKPDGTTFTDRNIHNILKRKGIKQLNVGADKNEWYRCTVNDIKSAILEITTGAVTESNRVQNFLMRDEQKEAVKITEKYFIKSKTDEPNKTPKFLWNCKMRFGKTFAAYQLAKSMNLKKILVLTFKPAVESAWKDDLLSHIDFKEWQFVSDKDSKCVGTRLDKEYQNCDKSKPIVVFGSFQNLLGTNENGGIKAKNEFIHKEKWDLVIFDEYHFGTWRENAKKLFEYENEEEEANFDVEKYKETEADNAVNESFLPITTKFYLYLSGTPFRAINSGEFIEEQIYNWTYSDEQREKENWKGKNNPYAPLPRMVMMTYQIPDSIKQIAVGGEFNEFDLNVFFSAEGSGKNAQFKFKNEVQKWLDLIRGQYLSASIDDLKLGQDKRPPMPYSDARLLNILSHTIWFLPNVASCEAMANLINEKQNRFYHDYKINVCAGVSAGIGLDALQPVKDSMNWGEKTPLETKTITLTCGKLTTGVTVRPWTGIFMLRNLKSPETYFQAAFRVQSPWTTKKYDGSEEIIKEECYVFDFALDRALKQIADYSCSLNPDEPDPEKKVSEFIKFLPVLAYDGSTMKQINAQDVLDIAMSGTSATLLARRWESALLVNVDNATLAKLMANKEALEALMNIEGFRSLNSDIETIINKSDHVKKVKTSNKKLSSKEKKELTEEEKEYRNKRKQIQEKLIKFATRIPIFMYLTDYREKTLKDVIMQLEPGLFKKVTGLNVKDFELLCSLGVFNATLMNDAIFKFKRYEDASLSYTGIEKHSSEGVGGWDTVIQRSEYEKIFFNKSSNVLNNDEYESITDRNQKIITKIKKTQIDELTSENVELGLKIKHKLFGLGYVTKIYKVRKKVRVTFESGKDKVFSFKSLKNEHIELKK